jgi:hypothetical protein
MKYNIEISIEWEAESKKQAELDLLEEVMQIDSILWRTTGYTITKVKPGEEVWKEE